MSRLKRHPLIAFFVLTFVLSWSLWLLPVLHQKGWLDNLPSWWGLGGFGPSLAGLVMVGWLYGRAGLWRLFQRLTRFKASIKLYLAVLLLPPLLVLSALALGQLVFHAQYNLTQLPGLVIISLLFVQILLLGGPLNEELGWRGFALPQLQKSTSALHASLIIGVIWALWHLPLFWANIPGYTLMPFYLYGLNTLALAIIFTWLYNSGRGQLWLALLLHALFNTVNWLMIPLLPHELLTPISAIYVGLMLLVASAIVIKFGPHTLSSQPKSIEI
jgi:membrane protease YdiL (CAAX protease family)